MWPQVVFVEREVPVEVQRVVIREVPYKVEVDRPVVTVVEKAPPPPSSISFPPPSTAARPPPLVWRAAKS